MNKEMSTAFVGVGAFPMITKICQLCHPDRKGRIYGKTPNTAAKIELFCNFSHPP